MGDVRRLRDQVQGRRDGGAEMVRCRVCGSFVASSEAVTIRGPRTNETFCSTECLKNLR